jgi:PBP1b-binding outer membrane lipoprotein LpoB
MKKIIFLLIVAFFLAGCTAEWYKHDTIYKDHDQDFFN